MRDIVISNLRERERIHIALSPWDLTDDYNRHAGVTMLSALEHCSYPATIHLLYDAKLSVGKEKEEAYNKSCYQKIADRYECELQFHHIDLPEWVSNIPALVEWTPGSLLRLYLPDLLPTCDKIIYFDCDTVIRTNLSDLWNISLGNYYLAACRDSSIPGFNRKRKSYCKKLGIEYKEYFCSGILVLNLTKLRDAKFTDTIFSYLLENPYLRYPDQDMLNWYCQGNYLHLDEKMNIYSTRQDVLEFTNDCILHYATRGSKPWVKYNGNIDDYYWKYLSDSPWSEDKMLLISYTRNAPCIENTLSLLQKDFFLYQNGTKVDEIKQILHLGWAICKSILRWGSYIIK